MSVDPFSVMSKIDTDLPLKEQALTAFRLRNEIKLEARVLMSDRAAAAALPAPKTVNEVVKKAHQKGYIGDDVWRYVMGSSTRSNKNVDAKLGLSRK